MILMTPASLYWLTVPQPQSLPAACSNSAGMKSIPIGRVATARLPSPSWIRSQVQLTWHSKTPIGRAFSSRLFIITPKGWGWVRVVCGAIISLLKPWM